MLLVKDCETHPPDQQIEYRRPPRLLVPIRFDDLVKTASWSGWPKIGLLVESPFLWQYASTSIPLSIAGVQVLLMTNGPEDNFEALLRWLDADRDRAGVKYEEIRESLINIFSWRGFRDADELADETIARVTAKVQKIARDYQGDPALYFYAVAKKLALEVYKRWQRQRTVSIELTTLAQRNASNSQNHLELDCLEKCLGGLPLADRELILLYYQQEQPKTGHRKELATLLGLTMNTVRIRTFRIRQTLLSCIENCLKSTER